MLSKTLSSGNTHTHAHTRTHTSQTHTIYIMLEWNNIKECVLDTLSDLVGKVEKRARNPWITQEMISKMDERRKWKNVNTEEGGRTTGG